MQVIGPIKVIQTTKAIVLHIYVAVTIMTTQVIEGVRVRGYYFTEDTQAIDAAQLIENKQCKETTQFTEATQVIEVIQSKDGTQTI